MKTKQPSFLTLLLLISFASVNAVLFTPALPAIARFFVISESAAQQTVTWFLVGYAIGQLLYGPFANRFGRKPALYAGILLQIASSFLCVFAGFIHDYFLLVLGRFLLALGSGVGLKMTFTLVNEIYDTKLASQKLSYLIIAFAITPGIGVMFGGILLKHFDWTSTFYSGAIYGLILLFLTTRLPETKTQLDLQALKLNHLFQAYVVQFKNHELLVGGFIMGCATCFVYVFAALAPFIAMNILHMDTADYGIANLLPPVGLIIGSLFSAKLTEKYHQRWIISLGIGVAFIGSLLMLIFALMQLSALFILFIPLMFCYFGLALVFANASTIAMRHVSDKAHGSAVMSFINMGFTTIVVLGSGLLKIKMFLLPEIYLLICITAGFLIKFFIKGDNHS